MLEVRDLNYTYREKKLFRKNGKPEFTLCDINFTLGKGYILGVLGLNGAGKSTLMELLMGIYIPESGSVTYDGEEVSKDTTKTLQKIACVSENVNFIESMTLQENVEFFGVLYDNFDNAQWEEYMFSFGFTEANLEQSFGTLSTGQQRKFQLAFALAFEPELLILDEPTANLDPHARVEWMELLKELTTAKEISVIMSTHLTSDLDELADYILIMHEGKQLAFMDREELVDKYGERELAEILRMYTA